jgi:hypothetical protein
MSKFWGPIGINRGFQETGPGIIDNVIEEVYVKGEIRNVKASWSQQTMNDTLQARHLLSVVTPEDSEIDFNEVVYIVWQGHKWAVTSIQYNRPRVELTLGGLYNE